MSEPGPQKGQAAPTPQRVPSMLQAAREEAQRKNRERRARVLAHPDLARRLTQPPLSYKRPEQWNGYIAPRLLAEDACSSCSNYSRGRCPGHHVAKVNDSPRRAALVAIAREAAERAMGAAP